MSLSQAWLQGYYRVAWLAHLHRDWFRQVIFLNRLINLQLVLIVTGNHSYVYVIRIPPPWHNAFPPWCAVILRQPCGWGIECVASHRLAPLLLQAFWNWDRSRVDKTLYWWKILKRRKRREEIERKLYELERYAEKERRESRYRKIWKSKRGGGGEEYVWQWSLHRGSWLCRLFKTSRIHQCVVLCGLLCVCVWGEGGGWPCAAPDW